jgi:menaquinone-9 beta-reductase
MVLHSQSAWPVVTFLSSAVLVTLTAAGARSRRLRKIRNIEGENEVETVAESAYDAIIVGAGPSGSTAAYYLGQQGKKVALCDRKSFPRFKPCGDAWCAPALTLLQEMGILEKMEADGIARPVRRGGLISPFGYRCINTDGDSYGSVTGCKTYAIKRYIADEYIVRAAAKQASVTLMENCDITNAELDKSTGLWTVNTAAAAAGCGTLKAKMLLICDGSTSYLAQKLGIIPKGSQPAAVCSHAYAKGGTHKWGDADGVMIFNKAVLPGYSALFRHYNDDMYLGTYILPGGKATSRAIAPFEGEAMEKHPYIRDAFGEEYSWEEKRVVAPIRCGGVDRSYGERVLLVGDAAGHVDPLTGEGIHTAMLAGKIAAQAVGEMFSTGNFTEEAGLAYHLRCYDAFGYEFWSSALCARIIYALPIAIDALAVVGQRKGQWFLDFFGECMTGVRPKSDFAQPLLLAELALETLRQAFLQYVMRIAPEVPQDIGVDVVNQQAGKKQGNYA